MSDKLSDNPHLADFKELALAVKNCSHGFLAECYNQLPAVLTALAKEREEADQLRQAVGLMTILKPTMQMDVLNPLGMMQEVHAFVTEQLAETREQLADCNESKSPAALRILVSELQCQNRTLKNQVHTCRVYLRGCMNHAFDETPIVEVAKDVSEEFHRNRYQLQVMAKERDQIAKERDAARTELAAAKAENERLRTALRGPYEAVKATGYTYHEPDWNPDAHVEVTLTVAEVRQIRNAVDDEAALAPEKGGV